MSDLHDRIMNLPHTADIECDGITQEARFAYKTGHRDARHAAAELAAAMTHEVEDRHNPAMAAIHYALTTDEGLTFLRLWNEGDFDALRREWPDVPDAVFVGADAHYTPTSS